MNAPDPEDPKFERIVIPSLKRSYRIISEKLIRIFDFVEPRKENASCFGHEIYQLLLVTATGFEQALKLVYQRESSSTEKPTMGDYKKSKEIAELRLPEYTFTYFQWGEDIRPLEFFSMTECGATASPPASDDKDVSELPSSRGIGRISGPNWWADYNAVKHNRETEFEKANLRNLLLAHASLTAALDAATKGDFLEWTVLKTCDGELIGGQKFGAFTRPSGGKGYF